MMGGGLRRIVYIAGRMVGRVARAREGKWRTGRREAAELPYGDGGVVDDGDLGQSLIKVAAKALSCEVERWKEGLGANP